jgi:hypothetical protein
MSYTIKRYGQPTITVPDGTINTETTVTLVGKNYAGYGQFLDQNSMTLLQNSAGDSPPVNPQYGQLWWDAPNQVLKVFNGSSFKGLSSSIASPTPPINPALGDMWFNTIDDALSVWNGNQWVIIGPSIINGTGVLSTVIEDVTGLEHSVVEIIVGTSVVGIVSKDPTFTPLATIPGFVTVGPGYNVANVVNGVPQYYNGTATNALRLQGYDPNAFMSAIANTGTIGSISVQSNSGLTTGSFQNFSFYNTGNDGVILNNKQGGNIQIDLNVGGTIQNVAVFYGGNGNASFSGDITSNSIHANTIYSNNIVGGYGNANVATFLASGNDSQNIITTAYFIGDGGKLSNINPGNVAPGPGVVRVVNTGVGLTGGPITETGTISLLKSVSANAGVGGTIGGVIPDGQTVVMNPSTGVISAVMGPIGTPTVTGFTPITGPVAGGTIVVINGTFFTQATSVSIGGVPAAHFSVSSPTLIVAVTGPSAGPTNGVVTVTTPGGSGSSIGTFAYVSTPEITSFTPISSPTTGGTIVTINGTNLTGTSSVSVAGIPATSVAVHSATQVTAQTAAAPSELIGPISVITPSGAASSADMFAYTNVPRAPVITDISITSGPITGGTQMTITGTNLTATIAVFVAGQIAASFQDVSDTQIICVTAPVAGPVAGEVQVLTVHGSALSSEHFTYYATASAPTISFISPTSGPLTGGTIGITGTNFTGATSLQLVPSSGSPIAITNFSVSSATLITAVMPAQVASVSGHIMVTTPAGSVTSTIAYTYYNSPSDPTISSFAPVYGSTTQPTTVQIVGTNFLTPSGGQAIIGVSFVGVSASHFNATDSNNITAIAAPAPANAGYVTVQGVVASATSVKIFTYAAIPGITSFSPVVGPTSGYTPIVITGTNFAGVTSGTVVGQAAPTVSVINPSIVEMTTPPQPAGSGVITLTNVDGTGTSTTPYTYSTTPGDVGVTSVGVGTGLVSTTGAAPITTTGTISLSKAVAAVVGVGGSIGGVYPDGTTITMNANGMITAIGGGGGGGGPAFARTNVVATAGQTTFTVPTYTVGYVQVYVNGVFLDSSEFTAASGTTVVLIAAANAGDLVDIVAYQPTPVNITAGTGISCSPPVITGTGSISLVKATSASGGIGGSIGGVIPDGVTITMDTNGIIRATSAGTVTSITAGTGIVCSPSTITTVGSVGLATASTTQLGGVRVDGSTIVASSGTISTGPVVLTQANWNNVTVGGGLTLANGQRHFLSVAAQTVTLPATPPVGAQCIVGVLPGDTTSVIAGNGQNIMGLNQNMTVNVGNVSVTLEYVNASFGWRII